MPKRWKILGTFALVITVILTISIGYIYRHFLQAPLIPNNQPAITYILKPGASLHQLAADLQAQKLLTHPIFFISLAYAKQVQKHLKAGEYLITPGTTAGQLLDQMANGKVVQHRFTIVEGWTFRQLFAALNKEPLFKHTINNQSFSDIATKLKLTNNNLEGIFFPTTYYFVLGATDFSILEKAHNLMKAKLKIAWEKRSANLPYQTVDQALIAASLVEKETAQPSERSLVAGVLVKRLQLNMPLQIDSTVIYGLGLNYTGKIHTADLRQDTPYNTYTRRGLPPTPIAMPSEQSIQAALSPAITEALYFVAKGDGTHQFSSTLTDHNHAVTLYQIDKLLPVMRIKKTEKPSCEKPWYVSKNLQALFLIKCEVT